MNIYAIVLAAGKGTRMDDPRPKVLVDYKDKPMLGHVLDSLSKVGTEKCVCIVGYKAEEVKDFVRYNHKNQSIEFALQNEQLGTGHAVMMAEENLRDNSGHTFILCGDVPNLSSDTLNALQNEHIKNNNSVTVLTAIATNPHGYGRIVKSEDGHLDSIVEEKDADEEIKRINEINSGTYLVDNILLFEALKNISSDNAQNEYYLTDIIKIIKSNGHKVGTFVVQEFDEIVGINSKEDLMKAELN
ncbi:MAG: hypothetical protein Kapaf2KO_14090 [Candidatus Kapaibacteriales bacterium]